MKSLFIAFTLLASLLTTTSFANDKDIAPAVLASFNATFTDVQQVEWSVSANLYRAQFVLNSQYANAYYNVDGTLVAVTRNITLQQLPVALQAAVKKEYATSWITELFELSNDEGVQYYMSLENADAKVTLKSTSLLKWNVYQRTKK